VATPIPTTCWGEDFPSRAALAADPRCVIDCNTLRRRLKKDWLPEDAAKFKGCTHRLPITCWGEDFPSISALAADPRCVINKRRLSERLSRGISPEKAAATKPRSRAPKSWQCWGKEFPTVWSLAADPRCVVTHVALAHRLRRGWTILEAVSRPAQSRRLTKPHECWGEKFTSLGAIANDVRCLVGVATLDRRFNANWTLEEAVNTPPNARRHQHST
jgi:hypothetical protein